MPKRERNLVIDIGSTAVHMGEFSYLPDGSMVLHAFTNTEYPEPLTEANRATLIAGACKQSLTDGAFSSNRRCSLCVSGQAAFMRFVKLPPVTDEEERIRQIVEYEARQNVPFPMNEVIWDYQLISAGDDDDLEVMFAVIKNDIVESTLQGVRSVGLKPELVDFSPAALFNAARANYLGEDGCCMLLDIGGRCTTLLFLDGPRFFARAIPIAGAAITQQIAKEFNISLDEAELLKRRHGFVALGGAYEEPESEVAATISKIVRNVMTRLHGEINRSINVYRTQQKGNKPTQLFLAGGSSTMDFTTHFFSEKLRMEVTYFNPLKVVKVGEEVSTEQLQVAAHLLPEVVGTGLRGAMEECPVEISLVTDDIRKDQSMSKRVPFVIATAIVWVVVLVMALMVNYRKIHLYQGALKDTKEQVERLERKKKRIERANSLTARAQSDIEGFQEFLNQRYKWYELYTQLQLCKPRDLWIAEISTDMQGIEVKQTRSRTSRIFGGRRRESKPGVQHLRLIGHAISVAEKNEAGEYTRSVFLPSQIEEFEKVLQKRIEEGEEPPRKEDELAAYRAERHQFWLAPKYIEEGKPQDQSFLESLKFSEYFSAMETRYLEQSKHQAVKNMTNFEILVKLEEPIE